MAPPPIWTLLLHLIFVCFLILVCHLRHSSRMSLYQKLNPRRPPLGPIRLGRFPIWWMLLYRLAPIAPAFAHTQKEHPSS